MLCRIRHPLALLLPLEDWRQICLLGVPVGRQRTLGRRFAPMAEELGLAGRR